MAATIKCDTLQNTSSATANVTLDGSGNATVGNNLTITNNLTVTGQTIPSSSFKRNRLINGNMYIAQRATSATVTAGTAVPTASTGYPCVDRWFVYSTGANVTAAQVAGSGSNRNILRITGAASVTAVGVGQRIEQLNSIDMAGQTATLSVELANSLLTTVTWTASYATTADTFGTIGTPTKTQIATGTFTVNSTLTRYTTNISIPAAATTGIEILFTVGAQTSGTWDVDNVQLEVGNAATPYERQIFSDQLAQCQRYYWIDRGWPDNTATARFYSGGAYNTTQCEFVVRYPVPMRIGPTLTSSAASTFAIYINNNYIAPTSVLLYAPTTLSGLIYTANSTVTAGQSANLANNPSSTTTYLGYSSEL